MITASIAAYRNETHSLSRNVSKEFNERTMVKLVLFDVGAVLIDLQSKQARRSPESEYGMATVAYEALTRCVGSH